MKKNQNGSIFTPKFTKQLKFTKKGKIFGQILNDKNRKKNCRKISVAHLHFQLDWHFCSWWFSSLYFPEKIPRIELSFTNNSKSLSLSTMISRFLRSKGAIFLRTFLSLKGCTFDFNWNFRFIFSRKVWKMEKFEWKTSLKIRLQITH